HYWLSSMLPAKDKPCVLDVRLESASIAALLSADASSSAEFVITAPRDMEASRLGLRIGPFPQLLVLVGAENYTENLLERTRYNFSAANLVGLGSQLTIIIQVQAPPGSGFPTLEVRTVFVVSFQQPTVTSIETNMINNTVSLVQTTRIAVSGTNLAIPIEFMAEPVSVEIFVAGVPANCTTSDCQEPALQALLTAGAVSLCSDLVVVSTGTCTCSMEPTGHAQLAVCLILRTGYFAERYCAAFGPPGSLQPGQPAVGGLSQPVQDMSSSEPFIVIVDGDLPWDNVSQGYLQVWATPLTEVPTDVSNPGSGYQPLCSQAIRTENNSIQCFRNQNFNVSQLGSQSNVYVQSGPDATSSNLVQGALQINQPRIFEITRSHEFEVGALEVTIRGEHFGTEANGNMVVQLETFGSNTQAVPDLSLAEDLGAPTHFVKCQVISHQDTEVHCRVEDQSLFGAEVSGGCPAAVSEQYYNETVEVDEGRRLQDGLKEDPSLWEFSVLSSFDEVAIVWLALSLSQLPVAFSVFYELPSCGVGPALACNTCDIGFYMGLFGAGACTVCPEHETTNITGATSISSCDCMPGYFRTNSGEGGPILPYSSVGYWTPDRHNAGAAYLLALLPVTRVPSRNMTFYGTQPPRVADKGGDALGPALGECYLCRSVDEALAWGFLTALIRSLRSMDMDHTKIQHRMLESEKHTSWLGRLAESDHGEFRMVIVMVTSLQTLWTVSLMPLPYTRFTKDWLWTMGIVACDMSILRPQCAFRLSYLAKWLLQWATFFIVLVVLCVAMLAYCTWHKNRLMDVGYISPKRGFLGVVSVTMMLFLLVHLRDDLVFVSCVPCEDDKFCLAFQPVIECAMTNWEWTTMMALSILDLISVILLAVPVIALCIYASWKWQHGKFRGLADDYTAPWYVFFSEFWVKRHRGYIQEVREAVPEFQKLFLNDDVAAASSKEVWHRAIDLILAQEAEKADALLLRVISHMYTHSERFKMIDEDEGPAWEIIRSIRDTIRDRAKRSKSFNLSKAVSTDRPDRPVRPETEPVLAQVATDRLNPMEETPQVQQILPDEPVPEPDEQVKLKVSDVHHVKLTLDNLLDYARWSVPGARAIKRVLAYSWTFILLIARFVITIYAMLMRRDQSEVPVVYLLVSLTYVILGASLQPYVWAFLNDWEVAVHSLIYVFLVFVISGWSDIASDVLVVVATLSAIVPVILRFMVVLYGQDKEDPDEDPTTTQGSATYNLERLGLSEGMVSQTSSAAVGPRSTGRSIQNAGRHREHVRNYIQLVARCQIDDCFCQL
ncbi:UGT80B1, partial [Symbiodinium pilosum]